METETLMQEPVRFSDHIYSLKESLQTQDPEISEAYLMGISGEAFRFFYSRLDPLRGHRVFLQNPLRSACSALGYKYTVYYDEDPKDAQQRLAEHLQRKHDVIIETDHDWPLIRYAYHPDKVLAINGKREEISLEMLMRHWHPIEGMFELGPTGYYQFIVEDQERTPNARETALGALRRALKMLKGTRRIQGCAMGLEAFEELHHHLRQIAKSKALTVTQMERIAAWGQIPLAELSQSRRNGLSYLQQIEKHFEDDEHEQIELAIRTYQQLLEYYDVLAKVFPRMPETVDLMEDEKLPGRVTRRTALPFKAAAKRAAKEVAKIIKAETAIADAFHRIIRISERTKM